ncbi:alpha/beta hydrolase [Kribbella sp. NBC_01245]|uniref:poly(ethylene terephthalate) hydrolase family protein n=1 Tax=Kribbella sp. NBC_01245 TaxID=2903578 RepID=UPI002E2D26F9|nr:alpha/beta hydrolase [Kribbella sp. NBC_01245]
MRFRPRLQAAFVAAVLTATVLTPPAAQAAENPYERGPDPTNASIEAARGPFEIAQISVPASSVRGFRGGTIYYPTSTAEGTFGAIAISPGFTGTQSSVAWLGPRLASQGFVIITIDTLSPYDFPASRGDQLLAALDYLTGSSAVRTRIDATRLGAMGHSMGGGGSLEAAKDRPSLQAIVPLTAWNTTKNWSGVTVPSLVVGAENDTTASVGSHSEPFYVSLPAAPGKAYLELNNAGHSAPTSPNVTVAKFSISWLKRFIDNDVRYTQFICPGPTPSTTVEEYRSTCPYA